MCGSVIKSFSLLFSARRASMWGTLRWSRCYLIPGGGCGCDLGGIPYALGAGDSFALCVGCRLGFFGMRRGVSGHRYLSRALCIRVRSTVGVGQDAFCNMLAVEGHV